MNSFPDATLDSALSAENDSILPSSGFTVSVMSTVQEEARVPAPIPFPWKRALPGFAAYAAMITVLLAGLSSMLRFKELPPTSHLALQSWTALEQHSNGTAGTLWLGVASLLTLADVCLSRARRSTYYTLTRLGIC